MWGLCKPKVQLAGRCRRENMFRPWISFFIVICVVKITNSHGTEAFRNDLIVTESFFEKLTNDYGSILHVKDASKELDEKISKFVETLRNPIHWRHRRHLHRHTQRVDNGVSVLRGFSGIFEDPFPNVIAISVFTYYDGIQLYWFTATLDALRISLYVYNGNQFELENSSYPVTSGSGLIADCSELGCVLVISRLDGSVTVLRLLRETGGFVLWPVQYLMGFGDVRLSIWHGMNQMFLGIASNSSIAIYHWLGEHFDSIQVLNYGTENLTPFKIGGSLYLAITGARATVLRFFLQPHAFILAQRLPLANDVESFYMEKGHLREHYLVLSNKESTIIYKFVHDHFVPFQKIAKADRISSITTKETIVLLALTGNLLKVYQYDGWKFVELGVTMQEIDRIYPTLLDGEIILIVRHTNGTWKFNKLDWMEQSTLEILRAEIKLWCLDTIEKTKRQPPAVPKVNGTVKILQGQIGKLEAKSINGENTDQLIMLSNRFEKLRLNLTANEKRFSQLMNRKNPEFTTLHASKVSGKCESGCEIKNLKTSVKDPLLEKLARPNNMDQNLRFENVKVQETGNLRCPKPAVILKNVIVNGTINGITFESIRENLLRVTGDQEVTGDHIYLNLSASSGLIPLQIAVRSIQPELHLRSIKAKNLYLTQGGILLPLNGQPVAINETKTIAKVKTTGLVHLRGNLNGDGVKHLAPVTWIENPLQLFGNYSLQKVAVQNKASGFDLILDRVRSLKQIISEAVRLDEDVPVYLKLSHSKTTWTNISADITADWITVSTNESALTNIRNITGTKRCPNDLTITNSSYKALPVPKFQESLCASDATIPDIETLLVTVGQASAETLKVDYIFGASMLNATIADTATSIHNLSLSSKVFKGVVNVKNAMLDAIDGIDFQRLLTAMVGWREPGLVEGLVTVSNLAVRRLVVPNGFVPPLITRARNLICKGNIYFDALNGLNISNLVDVVVKLDEPTSLINVTFAGGLIAAAVQTSYAPLDFSVTNNMGRKTIAGSLKSANLILPYSFTYPSLDTPASLIIKGSATFAREPKVENINHRNLSKIFEEIWFTNKSFVLSNRVFVARHMVLERPIQILGWLNSQSYGPWNQLPSRLLSRTKSQEINTHVYFKVATVPNIVSKKVLNLSVPEIFLDGLGDRSLRKNGSQNLTSDMRFRKLIILDDLNARSRINGKDLSTDVVRFDVKENIITGKKTVLSLYADNINGGLNFGKWQMNTLKTSNTGAPIYIKGFKTFANLTLLKPVSVEGLVNDRRMENWLLKSSPQQITGTKKVHGSIYASKILIDGLVNDVNLTFVVEHQLKKNKQVQIIKTQISTTGDVQIIGDIVVKGLYHGVELKNLDKIDSGLEIVSERMAELKNIAKQTQTALSRRAWYWNKLELVEVNSTILTPDLENLNSVAFEGLGSCTFKDGLLICDDETVQVLIFTPNSSRILFNEVFELEGIPLVVFATSDPNGGVWIYSYETMEKKFQQIAGLNLPGTTQASAIVSAGSLWLTVQLTWDTIILRYEIWGQFEEYTLPGTELFLMEKAPTGELLVFRSDGVWRLGGLSGPRQLARVQLIGEIDTFVVENDHYVQLIRNNNANLLKTRYIGN